MIKLTTDQLRQLQSIELEMLAEFDRICRKHNILYSIDGGTLLGAVRHEGFIPWDDDADVIMNRQQYDLFLAVVDRELNSKKFYFQDINRTKGYRWGYGKLRRKHTKFVRENQEHLPYGQGVFLDIFVCDNVPETYLFRCLINFQSFVFRKFFYSVVGKYKSRGFARWAYTLMSYFPEEVLKHLYSLYVQKRNRHYSKYVKCLTYQACNSFFGYKRSWYEDTIDIKFEGVTLKASRAYDEYLTFMYGDYMELPPLEQRKVHPVSQLKLLEE